MVTVSSLSHLIGDGVQVHAVEQQKPEQPEQVGAGHTCEEKLETFITGSELLTRS